jgi:hypothetical protein
VSLAAILGQSSGSWFLEIVISITIRTGKINVFNPVSGCFAATMMV